MLICALLTLGEEIYQIVQGGLSAVLKFSAKQVDAPVLYASKIYFLEGVSADDERLDSR